MFQRLHDRIDKKIDALPPGPRKQQLQEFYYSLLQDLRGFKLVSQLYYYPNLMS
jgi:hypothetical protein